MKRAGRSLLLLAAGALAAAPHPGHTSYAEAVCNQDRQRLEVSLAMLGVDFEGTLSRRAGKRVNLDRTPGIRALVEQYLAERFVVTLPGGARPRPRFAGHEDEGKHVWIYFTVPLVAPKAASRPTTRRTKNRPTGSLLRGVQLRNRVLMEYNAEQRNAVELREGHWRRVLEFTERKQEQTLRTRALPEPTPASGALTAPAAARARRRASL